MTIFNVPLDELRQRGSIKWRRFEPDVLPMFVAEMDAEIAVAVRDRIKRAIRDSDTGYPELPAYQEAMADYAQWQWGWQFDTADAMLVADVVTGMREAVLAFTEPGDRVLINPPVYPPFRSVSHGREVVTAPMLESGRLDLAAIEAAFVEHRPALYLLCSPHNPTGAVHTVEELRAVAALADAHGVIVASNEIHAPLAGTRHTPYLQAAPGARAVIITSASKCWNLAALKAALIIGPADLRGRINPVVSDSASYFGILAHTTALREGREWLAQASQEIDANKAFFAEELARQLPQLTYTPSEGTYLAWLDCSPLGLEHPGRHFHDVGRVRFNFGTDFSPESTQFVRVNLASSREIITEGIRRMASSII
ncbi:aminotransferase class I/II-fold pyridoxal phosphate-dependent enzyme [Tessaracoccus sp. MC1865]|uniref:MalY/PatB family protein n=1 Tax=Tessaracoccus sp. MC1865 TaxID=2760310 RepID=UPI00160060BC|nr:aminotransferase class I/II-fold pyridoxal phosphate-dependent enzyme [Tessaracoccus sp. MC1865]MBB1482743.1 aminotransferase class I/II-fold pyridoxal phosphate-dependent enzyme [Tessaracoccus sp. MC1865]QTO37810.1 aminotransferase class I/II-fold pyridoxal phosphate-dependent enzyme [Tessaracoccus sp. MC1865]